MPDSNDSTTDRTSADGSDVTATTSGPYSQLPPLIDPADTLAMVDPWPPQDPEGGRNTDQEFVARHGAA